VFLGTLICADKRRFFLFIVTTQGNSSEAFALSSYKNWLKTKRLKIKKLAFMNAPESTRLIPFEIEITF
jgi:hypothetical protein